MWGQSQGWDQVSSETFSWHWVMAPLGRVVGGAGGRIGVGCRLPVGASWVCAEMPTGLLAGDTEASEGCLSVCQGPSSFINQPPRDFPGWVLTSSCPIQDRALLESPGHLVALLLGLPVPPCPTFTPAPSTGGQDIYQY